MTELNVTLGTTRDVEAVVRVTPAGKRQEISPAIKGGEPVTFDLRKAPHMLVAGTTGSGKSVAIHAMLADLLSQGGPEGTGHTPETLGLVLVDPKRVELSDYSALPHLTGPSKTPAIYRDPLDAIAALEWVLAQVELRFTLMQECNVRDISGVSENALWDAGQPRSLLVVVDELADLMMATGSLSKAQRMRLTDPEITLARILQIGRAAGVHCILATQRPSSDIVTGVIKANVPTRLTFALQNATDSRVAMGQRGAEELTGKGDALWLPVGARRAVRLQGRFVSDAERLAIVAGAAERCMPMGDTTESRSGHSTWAETKAKRAQQREQIRALSLDALEMPAEPIGHGKQGEVTKRQARLHTKRVRRTEAWNQAGRAERAVATVLGVLVVAAFVLAFLVSYLTVVLR